MRVAPLALMVLLSGCSLFGSDDGAGICTAEFRAYTVEVVGRDGAPVPDLSARSVVVSTGAVLENPDASDPYLNADGVYYVASDGDRGAISRRGTAVRFTAQNDSLLASADYVFGFDGCHVSRVSGPPQITAVRR